MKIRFLLTLLLVPSLWAQIPAQPPPGKPVFFQQKENIIYKRELGKWWENPEITKKLQLSDDQTNRLNQIFFDHRLKLIDYTADMQKQDLKLQHLLDADNPNDAQVSAQVDQVLAARGKLEREFTMMNLDLRKVLSVEQWRQLKSIRGNAGAFGDRIMFFRQTGPRGGPGPVTIGPGDPPLPPPPPDPGDDLF